jgi:hypothetical protein
MDQLNKPLLVKQFHNVFIKGIVIFGSPVTDGLGEVKKVRIVPVKLFIYLFPLEKYFSFVPTAPYLSPSTSLPAMIIVLY